MVPIIENCGEAIPSIDEFVSSRDVNGNKKSSSKFFRGILPGPLIIPHYELFKIDIL